MLPQVDWNSPREMGRNPPFFPVGTQWETCGKNRRRGLGTKGFPQKKVLSLVLCVAMLLSVMVMGTGAASFTDQDEFSDNYAEAAEVLTGMGIIQGYDDGSFLPQRNINRAQVATMIYRAATGDVTDSKISQFVGEDLFDDVNADDWFAGYVNYCGNAEYIKGFTPDTFGPYKQVTGYQVLAMILRAVGYDENDEYTGDQWTLRVAATAREQGLLDNLNPDTNLAEPATRELVAELIFRAIHPDVETVHYVPAEGDYAEEGSSLGEQVFDLAVDNDYTDMWGRPATVWYADNDPANGKYDADETVYADIADEPLATYTTAVNDCDVYDETGVSGTVPAVINGNDTSVNISRTATNESIGAQGRLTEVYEDCVVMIDTFLAQVTDVTETRSDANGHLAREALLELLVYNSESGEPVYLTADSNWSYAVGDMLLVNVVTDDDDVYGVKTVTDSVIGYNGTYPIANGNLEIVSAATSFVGGQSSVWVHPDYHTIDGEDYMDALHFYRDDTEGTQTVNHNWWLDQYGNLIGATNLARTDYAVLKDIVWVVGSGSYGHAQATLVYMDGTEASVEVNSIDGRIAGAAEAGEFWNVNDVEPSMDDANTGFAWNDLNVSEEPSANSNLEGYALYLVYTNDDGTVNLEGYDKNSSNVVTDTLVEYASGSTIDVGGSTIEVGNQVETNVDSDTQFLVRTGSAGSYTYTTYNINNLPDFADGTIEVFWSNDGTFTENVYIKTSVPQATTGTHLFATTNSHTWQLTDGESVVHAMNVVVDGEERTILTTDANVISILENNVGKLFHVDFDGNAANNNPTYGYVTDVELVNEDSDLADSTDELCDYMTNDSITVRNGAIAGTDASYNLTDAVEVIYSDRTWTYTSVAEAVGAGCDVWVVDDSDSITNRALTIYVGTALSDDDTITVATEGEDNIYDISAPDADGNYIVTLTERNTSGELTIDADNDYALYVVEVNGTPMAASPFRGDETATVTGLDLGDVITVTVYPENGVGNPAEYTINVNKYYRVDGAITSVESSDGNTTLGGAENPLPMYSNFGDAVKNAAQLSRSNVGWTVVSADNDLVVADVSGTTIGTYPNYVAKSHHFTNSAQVTEGTFNQQAGNMLFGSNGTSETSFDISNWDGTDYYVIRMCVRDQDTNNTPNDDEYVYFAFQVQ